MEERKKVNDFLKISASFSLRERERERKPQLSFFTFFDEHHFVDEKVGKRGGEENKRKERDECDSNHSYSSFFSREKSR